MGPEIVRSNIVFDSKRLEAGFKVRRELVDFALGELCHQQRRKLLSLKGRVIREI